MQYKNPFLHFQEEVAFRTYVAMDEKERRKNREKYPQIPAAEERVYCGDVCAGE